MPVVGKVPRRQDGTLLRDALRADQRAVAVGARGTVFVSSDGGKDWKSQRTASTRTLTAVTALDDKTWLAVGHGGTILRSEDGVQSWSLVDVPDAGTDALLGVTALDARTLVAYGAFGLYLKSTDEGRTWTRQDVVEEGFDRHIAKIIALGDALVLVGEDGLPDALLEVLVDFDRTFQPQAELLDAGLDFALTFEERLGDLRHLRGLGLHL